MKSHWIYLALLGLALASCTGSKKESLRFSSNTDPAGEAIESKPSLPAKPISPDAPLPEIIRFESAAPIVEFDGATEVLWETSNTTQCQLTNRLKVNFPATSPLKLSKLRRSLMLTLSCNGPGGIVEKSLLIRVRPGPNYPAQTLGYLDQISTSSDGNYLVTGWTCDRTIAESIGVHLYVGGPAGAGQFLKAGVANQTSEQAVSSLCTTSGVKHRFSLSLTRNELLPHRGKKIYAHGLSAWDGPNSLLGNSGNLVVPTELNHNKNKYRLGLGFRQNTLYPVLSGSTPDGKILFSTGNTTGGLYFVPLLQSANGEHYPEHGLDQWIVRQGARELPYNGRRTGPDGLEKPLGFANQGTVGFDPRYGTAAFRVQSPNTCLADLAPSQYQTLPNAGRYLCYKMIVFNPATASANLLMLFHNRLALVLENFDATGNPLTHPRIVAGQFYDEYRYMSTRTPQGAEVTHYGLEVSVTADSRLLVYNVLDVQRNNVYAYFSFSERPWLSNSFDVPIRINELHKEYANKLICLSPNETNCNKVRLGNVYRIAQQELKEPVFGKSLFEEATEFRCGYAWITPEGGNVFCSSGATYQYVAGFDTEYSFYEIDGIINGFHQRNYANAAGNTFTFAGINLNSSNLWGMFPSVWEKRIQMPIFLGTNTGMWRAFPYGPKPNNFAQSRRKHTTHMLLRSGKFEAFDPKGGRILYKGKDPESESHTFVHAEVNFDSFLDPNFVTYHRFQTNHLGGYEFQKPSGTPNNEYLSLIKDKMVDGSGNYNYIVKRDGALDDQQLAEIQGPNTFEYYFSNKGYLGQALHFAKVGASAALVDGSKRPVSGTYSELSLELAFRLSPTSQNATLNIAELNGAILVDWHSNKIRARFHYQDRTVELIGNRALAAGNWHHLGLRFWSDSTLNYYEMYLNGHLVSDKSAPKQSLTIESKENTSAVLGPNGACTRCGVGVVLSIDEFAISSSRRMPQYFETAAINPKNPSPAVPDDFPFPIPRGFRKSDVQIPPQMAAESRDPKVLVALAKVGRMLFHDTDLSLGKDGKNKNVSCATCHDPNAGFADNRALAQGIETLELNSPTIINRLFSRAQFFDKRSQTLFEQTMEPVRNPKEMGGHVPTVLKRLNNKPEYIQAFKPIFGKKPITEIHVQKALTAFMMSVTSGDAPVDKPMEQASNAYKLGRTLFFGKARCVSCHSGPNFTDEIIHNTGNGRAVKTPTLREIDSTAPYFHNGSAKNLTQVVHSYNTPRTDLAGLDPEIRPLGLTPTEVEALVIFLKQGFSGYVNSVSP